MIIKVPIHWYCHPPKMSTLINKETGIYNINIKKAYVCIMHENILYL